MQKRIVDALEEINQLRGKKQRIEKMHEYSSLIKPWLDMTYSPKIKWLVPEGVPPYKPSKDDSASAASRFLYEMKKINKFLVGGPYPFMDAKKREKLFIEILEFIEPKDAVLLCGIKDKKLPYDKIDKNLVEEAFPLLAAKWTA